MQLILLVSCAHALVHVLEQSVASIELVVSKEFRFEDLRQSGLLGLAIRLPYGLGAFFAGLLADRFGEKRILVLYLFGSALVTGALSHANSLNLVYAEVFTLGCFASMYHPAGLALLANQTTPSERSRALGLHGVFGSIGIATAPFIAGFMLTIRPGDWRAYYLLLSGVSCALAMLVWRFLHPAVQVAPSSRTADEDSSTAIKFQRGPYALLVLGTALGGTVYGGVLHFLPRYLTDSAVFDSLLETPDDAALGNYTAAVALICGAFGQWIAGRLARPRSLPVALSAVYALNIPFLLWMAVAEGNQRLVAACLWAFFHFMNQPIYNSLLPDFLPVNRRSVGYGFSNLMGFGVGAVGPYLVADLDSRVADSTYGFMALAGLALIAALLPLPLMRNRQSATSA